MAEVIRMPKMSDTMTEGVIVEWLKKVGDTVKSGDILAEVETDKATMELENYVKGEPGEDISALLAGGAPAAKTEAPKEEAKAENKNKEELKEMEKMKEKEKEKPLGW
eukprot:gene48800-66247_t